MHARQIGNFIQKMKFILTCFRLTELVAKGDGIAIIEKGMSFGGGNLQNYGINSNTSANGFIKCLYRRKINIPDN